MAKITVRNKTLRFRRLPNGTRVAARKTVDVNLTPAEKHKLLSWDLYKGQFEVVKKKMPEPVEVIENVRES